MMTSIQDDVVIFLQFIRLCFPLALSAFLAGHMRCVSIGYEGEKREDDYNTLRHSLLSKCMHAWLLVTHTINCRCLRKQTAN